MSKIEIVRLKKLLKKNGHFVTAPRLRLFSILQSNPTLSMKELIELSPKHDQATIYRNIELFEKLGIINRLRLGWQTKIELSDIFQHHHHHMTCTNCLKIWTLPENLIIERQITELALEASFQPADHQLEIRGLCKTCQKKLH